MKLERAFYPKIRGDLLILHIYRRTQEFETKIIKLLILTTIRFDLGKSPPQKKKQI
jgi:hypothetical protein